MSLTLELNDLNDDCLRLIIKNLGFNDQLSMGHVCQRFFFITERIWRQNLKIKKNKLTVTEKRWLNDDYNKKYCFDYLRCICNNVEDLTLMLEDNTDIVNLENIQFPKVHTLFMCSELPTDKDEGKHSDDTLKLFKKILEIIPNLKRLKLVDGFTGEYLWMFESIEDLNIDYCENLERKYFKRIFSNLKKLKKLSILVFLFYDDPEFENIILCDTLEEIRMDNFYLLDIYKELFKFKKLRKIECLKGDDKEDSIRHPLKDIVDQFGSVMHTMAFVYSLSYSPELCEDVQKMVALRRLIFSNYEITKEQLRVIGASLGHTLEEFYYRRESFNKSERDELLDLLRQCTKLKILDLTNTNIDIRFVERVAKIISFDDEKRNQVLEMNCHQTKITKKHLKTLSLPKKLKISLENHRLDLEATYCYVCEWDTQPDENI